MWKKLLSMLTLWPILIAVFLYFHTQAYASHIPQCNPADIARLSPTATNVIDAHLCPPIKPCWVKHPPAEITYDCYSVIVAPPPVPPPGEQPCPPPAGAIDFCKLEQAIGLRIGGKTAGITLGDIVTNIVPVLFVIAGLILLLYLIWGGFSLMVSRGDPKAVESAKGRITNAIIGFVIIFIAYWLVQLLGTIFGIRQFEGIFGK